MVLEVFVFGSCLNHFECVCEWYDGLFRICYFVAHFQLIQIIAVVLPHRCLMLPMVTSFIIVVVAVAVVVW